MAVGVEDYFINNSLSKICTINGGLFICNNYNRKHKWNTCEVA